MAELIEPQEVEVTDRNGKTHKYLISKFPAVTGREIAAKYPTSVAAMAKQWEQNQYAENEKIMLKAMTFVEKINEDGSTIRLTTQALIDNHVPDAESLMQLEKAILEYNFSFFEKFVRSVSSGGLKAIISKLIMSTLTDSLRSFSQAEKPPSQN